MWVQANLGKGNSGSWLEELEASDWLAERAVERASRELDGRKYFGVSPFKQLVPS